MKIVAIVRRRLREGVSYEDFRRSWYHRKGFGAANRMMSLINAEDPREVIVIAITDTEAKSPLELLQTDQAERSEFPLEDVIERDISRTFGVLVAVDDFSTSGDLQYQAASIDGLPTDMVQVLDAISSGAWLVELAGSPQKESSGEQARP